MRIVLALVVLAVLAVLVVVGLRFDDIADNSGSGDAVIESSDDSASGETDAGAGDDATSETETAATGTEPSVDDQSSDTADQDAAANGAADDADEVAQQDDGDGTIRPSFDIVRVERTGDAVMAGRAAPFATVEIYDHNGLVASTQADEKGDWVIVLEEPLEAGSHELWLESPDAEGEKSVTSQETVVMLVPDADDAEGGAEVTVTTHIDPDEGTEEGTGDLSNDAIAVLLPKDGDGKVEILQEPEEGVGIAGGDGLSLDTLDYDETGDVSLSGRAEPGAEVRAYVDGELAGRTLADTAGNWRMTLEKPVDLGLHALRVEQVDEQGQVLGRLETPFDRESLQFPESAEPLVIIQPGNNLWTIARHTYGSGVHYTQIFKANQGQIADPHLIYPGQIFVLPAVN